MQNYQAIAIPAFRKLTDFTTADVRKLCIEQLRSSRNLASETPQPRKSFVLPLPLLTAPVVFLSFIPDGAHIIIFFQDGLVQLWDISCASPNVEDRGRRRCDLIVDPEYSAGPMGCLLSTHHLPHTPDEFDFETFYTNDLVKIIIAVFSHFE